MADTQRMTTAPESYVDWEKRTRPSRRSVPTWRSPGEIATIVFLAAFMSLRADGVVPAMTLLVVFGAAERLITPVALSRGLSLGVALVLRLLGTAALAAYALLPDPGWWGIAAVAALVAADWFVTPSLLHWAVSRFRSQ